MDAENACIILNGMLAPHAPNMTFTERVEELVGYDEEEVPPLWWLCIMALASIHCVTVLVVCLTPLYGWFEIFATKVLLSRKHDVWEHSGSRTSPR